MRGERPAAGQLAQHDAAPAEAVLELAQRLDDVLLLGLQRVGQLVDRHRVGREEEQRLDQPREPGHDASLSAAAWEALTMISPNGSSCSHSASPRL